MWTLEFLSWLSGNECNYDPRGREFNPWPCSVGKGSGIAMSCDVGHRCNWGNYSSYLTPSLGSSISHRCGPKNAKNKSKVDTNMPHRIVTRIKRVIYVKRFCKLLCKSEGCKVISTQWNENPIVDYKLWMEKILPKGGK